MFTILTGNKNKTQSEKTLVPGGGNPPAQLSAVHPLIRKESHAYTKNARRSAHHGRTLVANKLARFSDESISVFERKPATDLQNRHCMPEKRLDQSQQARQIRDIGIDAKGPASHHEIQENARLKNRQSNPIRSRKDQLRNDWPKQISQFCLMASCQFDFTQMRSVEDLMDIS